MRRSPAKACPTPTSPTDRLCSLTKHIFFLSICLLPLLPCITSRICMLICLLELRKMSTFSQGILLLLSKNKKLELLICGNTRALHVLALLLPRYGKTFSCCDICYFSMWWEAVPPQVDTSADASPKADIWNMSPAAGRPLPPFFFKWKLQLL